MSDMHELPIAEVYRGCELYGLQSAERIETAKKEIDSVVRMSSPARLAEFAKDDSRAPEARLLAKNKALAGLEQRQRKPIDVEHLHASTAGIERTCAPICRLLGGRRSDWPTGGWPTEWAPSENLRQSLRKANERNR